MSSVKKDIFHQLKNIHENIHENIHDTKMFGEKLREY